MTAPIIFFSEKVLYGLVEGTEEDGGDCGDSEDALYFDGFGAGSSYLGGRGRVGRSGGDGQWRGLEDFDHVGGCVGQRTSGNEGC